MNTYIAKVLTDFIGHSRHGGAHLGLVKYGDHWGYRANNGEVGGWHWRKLDGQIKNGHNFWEKRCSHGGQGGQQDMLVFTWLRIKRRATLQL